MTADVNAVVTAVFEHGPAEILVNDSHGDMQNLIHTRLDERVQYIQGHIKPLGMVQGLDDSFDAIFFVGYHARAGTQNGFIAHTGSGAIKGLWINGVEVGEGGSNAYFAGAYGVPVVLANGNSAFAAQARELYDARKAATKVAVVSSVARLSDPDVVHRCLRQATLEGLGGLDRARLLELAEPVTVRMRFATTTRGDIFQATPGMTRVDGYTIEFTSPTMVEAYSLVRIAYKYMS